MPHPTLLKEMGMTADEFGKLPPETDVEGRFRPGERTKLKTEAAARIAKRQAQDKGLHQRVTDLEVVVRALQNQNPSPPSNPRLQEVTTLDRIRKFPVRATGY